MALLVQLARFEPDENSEAVVSAAPAARAGAVDATVHVKVDGLRPGRGRAVGADR